MRYSYKFVYLPKHAVSFISSPKEPDGKGYFVQEQTYPNLLKRTYVP